MKVNSLPLYRHHFFPGEMSLSQKGWRQSVFLIFFFFNLIYLFIYLFLPCYTGMWDPSSPTRDWTPTPSSRSRVLTTGLPGKFHLFNLIPCSLQMQSFASYLWIPQGSDLILPTKTYPGPAALRLQWSCSNSMNPSPLQALAYCAYHVIPLMCIQHCAPLFDFSCGCLCFSNKNVSAFRTGNVGCASLIFLWWLA